MGGWLMVGWLSRGLVVLGFVEAGLTWWVVVVRRDEGISCFPGAQRADERSWCIRGRFPWGCDVVLSEGCVMLGWLKEVMRTLLWWKAGDAAHTRPPEPGVPWMSFT